MSELTTGRERVIEVFGDACPVCSHSVTGAHSIFGRCGLCGIDCENRHWPAENIERYQAYWNRRFQDEHPT